MWVKTHTTGSSVRALLLRATIVVPFAIFGTSTDVARAAEESASTIAPPSNLTASDHPNDDGTAIDLKWSLSPDDRPKQARVVEGYKIYRCLAGGSDYKEIEEVGPGITEFTDRQCRRNVLYLYEIAAFGEDGAQSENLRLERPIKAVVQWFDTSRLWFGAIVLAVCGGVVIFTEVARSGRGLHVREIAGLRAIDEAIGRATEMGRPCLFVPGIRDMNEIPTVAGVTMLSHVARLAAEYDATIEVPTARSLVMTAARETVQAAYLAAGRPEAYSDDRIYYVTEEQFAYVAYLTGYMVREKPAACFFAGVFFAESLILAETGNSVGAIQIAATAEAAQLPFFVAACDYTLIGEELFAASAYLSREPHELGALKGQDAGKLLAGGLLTLGSLVATAGAIFHDSTAIQKVLHFLTETLLHQGAAG